MEAIPAGRWPPRHGVAALRALVERLVREFDAPDADRLQARFAALAGSDPRLHFHLLPPGELDGLLGP